MLRDHSLPVVAWDGCVDLPPNLTEWCPEAVDRLTVGAVLELSRVRMENGSTWIGFFIASLVTKMLSVVLEEPILPLVPPSSFTVIYTFPKTFPKT